ncbi:MAG: acetate--CoA ligase [Deltaproteobacteria bacterium]|nr:acetate--CoA ligase [Deltaproteobacteria bacterium]
MPTLISPPEAFAAAAVLDRSAEAAHRAAAAADPVAWWADRARELLRWDQPFTVALDAQNPPFFRWFADGTLNVSANCLDRHLDGPRADAPALIFEDDDGYVTPISFRALHARVCALANGLAARGYGRGDRAILYLPMSIEAIVVMQACARLGITHSVVFGGFSAKALHERIDDLGATLVICADGQRRGGRALPLLPAVQEALTLGGCASVREVIVWRRLGLSLAGTDPREVDLAAVIAGQAEQHAAPRLPAEHPLFVLYTSGSTGKPKGVQHSAAGYLLHALLTTRWTFDAKAADVFWCTADVGWITGHTYVAYGPLAAGLTQVIFEGVPSYPHFGRVYEVIQRHGVTIFYTAPTAIRALIKASHDHPEHAPGQYDLQGLRLLGSVGEPINPEVWRWYHAEVGGGRCPIVDTFWQTETGGHVITPLPGLTPLQPGSCTLPFPGIDAEVVDEAGQPVPHGQGGLLVIRRPFPSMLRTIWGDPERFVRTYFPPELGGAYLAGDGAVRDPETGYFTITGRIDDVLNVSGHRLGTMEVESALVSHPAVAEAAVVGAPDPITGEAIVAFVTLKGAVPAGEAAAALAAALRAWVAHEISPIAKPRELRFVEALPKTRSGKIMRRLLRALARGEEVRGDTSTLDLGAPGRPSPLEQLAQVVGH